MARTARSLHARKKRKKVLEQAKGYRGTKKNSYKRAKEQVWKGGVYAYAGRKQRKRDFRALWIQRINAGVREHGLSYSQFVHGLRLAELDLDRKILADLAATEPAAFAAVVSQARNALNGDPVEKRTKSDGPGRQSAEQPAQAEESDSPAQSAEVEATEAAERKADELDVDLTEVEGSGSDGRVLVEDVEEAGGEISATDAAQRKAEELGVDLTTVEGTGANGRITVGDVENAAKEEGEKAD
jgi:large subunit ribosomal protein L20